MYIREWVVIGGCLGILLSLFCASFAHVTPVISEHLSFPEKKRSIQVQVSGNVSFPGEYLFPTGVTVGEVMKKVGWGPGSEKKNIYTKKVLLDSAEIVVFSKKIKKKQAKKTAFE